MPPVLVNHIKSFLFTKRPQPKGGDTRENNDGWFYGNSRYIVSLTKFVASLEIRSVPRNEFHVTFATIQQAMQNVSRFKENGTHIMITLHRYCFTFHGMRFYQQTYVTEYDNDDNKQGIAEGYNALQNPHFRKCGWTWTCISECRNYKMTITGNSDNSRARKSRVPFVYECEITFKALTKDAKIEFIRDSFPIRQDDEKWISSERGQKQWGIITSSGIDFMKRHFSHIYLTPEEKEAYNREGCALL